MTRITPAPYDPDYYIKQAVEHYANSISQREVLLLTTIIAEIASMTPPISDKPTVRKHSHYGFERAQWKAEIAILNEVRDTYWPERAASSAASNVMTLGTVKTRLFDLRKAIQKGYWKGESS